MITEFSFKRTWGPKPNYPRVLSYKRPEKKNIFIAGPCSVESHEQICEIARVAKIGGATHLRGGVFRAGTYPGAKFGLIDDSLLYSYFWAAKENGLENIIEVLDYSETKLDKVARFCTAFQIGARQMQNYTLLKRVAEYGKPIFLKRHHGSTMDEWLGAAEHILSVTPEGWADLHLIERGGVTHLNHVRWDLCISIIPAVKQITEIPIICDPSHGTGRRDLVEPMALAGIAAGADGLLVEFHTHPDQSISDPDQALDPESFLILMEKVKKLKGVL